MKYIKISTLIIFLTISGCNIPQSNQNQVDILPNSTEYMKDSSKVTVNYKDTTGNVTVIEKYHPKKIKDLRDTSGTIVFYARYQGTYFVTVDDSIVGRVEVHYLPNGSYKN